MSNEEYVVLGWKRLIATLFFKHTGLTNIDAIEMADKLLKDLD